MSAFWSHKKRTRIDPHTAALAARVWRMPKDERQALDWTDHKSEYPAGAITKRRKRARIARASRQRNRRS